jgi:hypothetical protein
MLCSKCTYAPVCPAFYQNQICLALTNLAHLPREMLGFQAVWRGHLDKFVKTSSLLTNHQSPQDEKRLFLFAAMLQQLKKDLLMPGKQGVSVAYNSRGNSNATGSTQNAAERRRAERAEILGIDYQSNRKRRGDGSSDNTRPARERPEGERLLRSIW